MAIVSPLGSPLAPCTPFPTGIETNESMLVSSIPPAWSTALLQGTVCWTESLAVASSGAVSLALEAPTIVRKNKKATSSYSSASNPVPVPLMAKFQQAVGRSGAEATDSTDGFATLGIGARALTYDGAAATSSQDCSARAASRSPGKPAVGGAPPLRSLLSQFWRCSMGRLVVLR